MLNRENAPWMGCWNGIGGKVEPSEHPREAMLREMNEETDIDSKLISVDYKGLMTWSNDQRCYYHHSTFSEDLLVDHMSMLMHNQSSEELDVIKVKHQGK
jgi:ADP-ribose pyrophosphatase YjhB (NUDIX family)